MRFDAERAPLLKHQKISIMKNLQQVQELLESYTVNGESWSYYVKAADIADFWRVSDVEELVREKLERAISESEVVYYSKAMEYLTEHDVSLTESLRLAAELGYEPANINSELLATLLLQEKLREDLESDLSQFLDDLDDLEDEEDEEDED